MALDSVADLRAARRVSPAWQGLADAAVLPGSFRFQTLEAQSTSTITAPSTSAGESPTMLGGVAALPAAGVLTRVDSDFGVRPWVALFDFVWGSAPIDTTALGVTAVGSSAFPPRDVDASSNGRGLVLAVFGYLLTTPTLTVTYTNSGGTSGRSASTSEQMRSAFSVIPLAGGDQGIRSVESVNVTTVGNGPVQILVLRPIGRFLTDVRRPGDRASSALQRMHPGTMLYPTFAPQSTIARASYIRADIALG